MMNHYSPIYHNKITAYFRIILLSLCSLIAPIMALGQNRSIKGTVTDAKSGEPLIGVAVKVRNSPLGTSTDVKGEFKLQVPLNAVLVVSYVGYETQTITVGNTSQFEIKLSPGSQALNEVVVVGYGTMR